MAKLAANASGAMLLSNLIQVTESISGSVVPMAMFFFAGLGLLRANWACSIRDLRDISCARRTCTEWLKGGDLDSSSLKAGLSISLEISSYAARAFLTERMRTTRPIDIAQYTTLAPCPSQQWRGPTDPEQGASTVISTAATHLPPHDKYTWPGKQFWERSYKSQWPGLQDGKKIGRNWI